jgi:NAD/NADP transhydrogenase beta subunit
MFNEEQRGLASDADRVLLAPILISLVVTYAGLSTAVAGLVLDIAVLVIAGLILVGSALVLVNLIAKATNRSEAARLDVYEEGEQCE